MRNPILYSSLGAFALLSLAVALGWTGDFDGWALRASQSRASERLDVAGTAFSAFGALEVSGVAMLALVAGLALAGRQTLAGRLAAAFAATGLLEICMKLLVPQTPVPDSAVRAPDPTPLAEVETPFPFPSGHMLRAMLLLGAIFVLWENRLARALLTLALLGMALSRVYLGVHWMTDVAGGALLGVAGLAWAFGKHSARKREQAHRE